jgi:hypothetical protein
MWKPFVFSKEGTTISLKDYNTVRFQISFFWARRQEYVRYSTGRLIISFKDFGIRASVARDPSVRRIL